MNLIGESVKYFRGDPWKEGENDVFLSGSIGPVRFVRLVKLSSQPNVATLSRRWARVIATCSWNNRPAHVIPARSLGFFPFAAIAETSHLPGIQSDENLRPRIEISLPSSIRAFVKDVHICPGFGKSTDYVSYVYKSAFLRDLMHLHNYIIIVTFI